MGGGTVAVAGAAEAPELELTGASVANGLPQHWQNVESSGRVAPQKRQNTSGIWDFQALRYRKTHKSLIESESPKDDSPICTLFHMQVGLLFSAPRLGSYTPLA